MPARGQAACGAQAYYMGPRPLDFEEFNDLSNGSHSCHEHFSAEDCVEMVTGSPIEFLEVRQGDATSIPGNSISSLHQAKSVPLQTHCLSKLLAELAAYPNGCP